MNTKQPLLRTIRTLTTIVPIESLYVLNNIYRSISNNRIVYCNIHDSRIYCLLDLNLIRINEQTKEASVVWEELEYISTIIPMLDKVGKAIIKDYCVGKRPFNPLSSLPIIVLCKILRDHNAKNSKISKGR